MKRLLFILALLVPVVSHAQTPTYAAFSNSCTQGATKAITQGMNSTNTLQGSYPSCVVTVFNTGTTTPATIYSDANGTPLSNPFTADTHGNYTFYAAVGDYDVTMSGGGNGGFPAPRTIQAATAINANALVVKTPANPSLPQNITGSLGVSQAISAADSILAGPTVDARSPLFGPGTTYNCANVADPSGVLDSTCAIQAAVIYAYSHIPITGKGIKGVVTLASGVYKITGSIRIPAGVGLATQVGQNNAVLQQNDPTAPLLVYYNGWDVTENSGGFGQANYGLIQNLTLAGNAEHTKGALLEIDSSFLVVQNVQYDNNGGRGIQWNNSERTTLINNSFYNNRQAIAVEGDANESIVYNMTGLANGVNLDNYCYDDNCVNGVFPAAGTTPSPTVLKINTHQAVTIKKSVNFKFIGGDLKDNEFEGGFQLVRPVNASIDTMYLEAALEHAWGNLQSSIVIGGVPPKVAVTAGAGMKTGTFNGRNFWSFETADDGWMTEIFDSLLDMQNSGAVGNFDPMVIIPGDYSPTVTTASAVCPGINRNQRENTGDGYFYGYGSASNFYFTSRNGNGVYNPTTNPTGAPANYDWSQCSSALIEEGYAFNTSTPASVYLAGIHSETVQGNVTQNGYTYDTTHQGSGPTAGEFEFGVTPGYGADYGTQYGATGSPLGVTNESTVSWSNPDDIFNGSNFFQGQMAVTGPSVISLIGQLRPQGNLGNDAFALTPDTANFGAKYISTANFWGPAKSVVDYPGATGTFPDAEVFSGDAGLNWQPLHNTYQKNVTYNNGPGSFATGEMFSSQWSIFDTPDSAAGTTFPTTWFHCDGAPLHITDPGCELDTEAGTSNAWTNLFGWHVTEGFTGSLGATVAVTNKTNHFTVAQDLNGVTAGAVENLAPNSGALTASTWGQSIGNPITVTANTGDVPDPWGGHTATKIANPASNFAQYRDLYAAQPLVTGTQYQVCAWMRGAAGGESITTGAAQSNAGTFTLTTSWQYICGTTPGVSNLFTTIFFFTNQAPAGGSNFYIAGVAVIPLGVGTAYHPTGAVPDSGPVTTISCGAGSCFTATTPIFHASATGCTTPATINTKCATDVSLTWNATLPNAPTSVVCTGTNPTGVPGPIFVTGESATAATVNYVNLTAAAASYGTLTCNATP